MIFDKSESRPDQGAAASAAAGGGWICPASSWIDGGGYMGGGDTSGAHWDGAGW